MTLAELRARTRSAFERRFGAAPALMARAPGRVNLIGEFTDYNHGYCLPCAIDRETVVAAAPRQDGRMVVRALDQADAEDSFELQSPPPVLRSGHWGNYVRGVVAALQSQGSQLSGASILISGNVPQGAGLSSSAALEVALGTALNALHELNLDGRALARAGQWAEHEYAGCNCGLMDQLASVFGQTDAAVLLDCCDLSTQAVPLPPAVAILVIESGIQRGLVQSEYNLRRQQCETAARHFGLANLRDLRLAQLETSDMDEQAKQRARHVVTDNARVLAATEALQSGDLLRIGDILRKGHASLRDDFEVSLPAIDALVDLTNEAIGSRGGARLTGGGFGGCVVALLPVHAVPAVTAAIQRGYRTPAGTPPTVHHCAAAPGASLL